MPGHSAGTGMSLKQRAHGSELHEYPIPRRPITFDPRQEPGAGKPHAGTCAGGGEQSSSLPRPSTTRSTRPPGLSFWKARFAQPIKIVLCVLRTLEVTYEFLRAFDRVLRFDP